MGTELTEDETAMVEEVGSFYPGFSPSEWAKSFTIRRLLAGLPLSAHISIGSRELILINFICGWS